ncbi:hypothetical protein Tco_1015954 [Tanacetum coccineum]|uniref:Uncharacterized protein n=1 Tax=Tanacetum coccineum TaxID=301880 RepID=A0ABQ5FNC5_9ASTR
MGNVKKSVAERTRHQRQYDRRVNKRQMQMQESRVDLGKALNASLVVTESSRTESGKKYTSSRSGNDADADNGDIKPVYDEEPLAEYTEKFQVKSPMLDPSLVNKTTESLNQSLESENIFLKKIVAQFQKDFSRMEAHCIALELKYQSQSLKSGQHGQFSKVKSNEANIKRDIDEIETINIELKLIQTKDHNDSLIVQLNNKSTKNADLKAHIQEKAFPIAALKNELRINQSVVRQPNALKSVRPKISKPRFASQVDVKKDLSKPVTQHYLPKEKESAFEKPNHMISSSESRNSSKNMSRFSSNDMVHNYYLEEAKKKTQEKHKNSKSSVMHSTRLQNTNNGSKPKPRSNNQTSRSLLVSNSSYETSNVVPLILTGHRFSSNKSSVVYEKTSPRSDLRYDSYDVSDRVGNFIRSLFDEYFNVENLVVSKSFAVTSADASDKRQQQPDSTSSTSTLATTVTADGNFDFCVAGMIILVLSKVLTQVSDVDRSYYWYGNLLEELVRKTIIYHLFEVEVEFHRCVIYKLMVLKAHICYHFKELRCCAQCLIEDEDFVKRLRSTYTLVLWSRSKFLIFICPLLDYDKKGKKMLTGRSMISTSGEALISSGFMMKFVQEHENIKISEDLLEKIEDNRRSS